MWPFRRRLSVSSPELVSAVPISQDGLNDINVNESFLNLSQTNNNVEKEVPEESSLSQPLPSASSSARKGISTWGRKVGRKWDEIKRADSSELLSVSGRRRHWSPNRKSSNEALDEPQATPINFLKPKRILRVKSLRHLFRHGDKSNNTSVVDDAKSSTIHEEDVNDHKLDKSFSEGTIRIPRSFHQKQDSLSSRKRLFCHSIHDIDKRVNDIDYLELSSDVLKTKTEPEVSKTTLRKKQSKCESVSDLSQSAGNDSKDRNEQRRSVISNGLEELVNNMKLGCDESGYDSDSTRTGADSPDCEKSNLKARSYSITSEDYRTLEATIPKSTQIVNKNPSSDSNFDEKSVEESCESTSLKNMSEVNGESTFCEEENSFLDSTLKADDDMEMVLEKSLNCSQDTIYLNLEEDNFKTPIKKVSNIRLTQKKKLRNKYLDTSLISLLDETTSPCKDTPPIEKLLHCTGTPTIPYYTPKRCRDNLDSSFEEPGSRQILKRPAIEHNSLESESVKRSFYNQDNKIVNLVVQSQGSLGIFIEERDIGKTGFVISNIYPNGDAAKSGQFKIGDEILRVNGKRLKRIGIIEARNVLKNCVGNVEIRIARQSFANFSEDNSNTSWPETYLGEASESTNEDIWSRQGSQNQDMSCEIVGFHRKDGKYVPVDDFGEMETEPTEKLTGMKKFVRKRASNASVHPRRALSLSLDTLTIILDKGAKKKLGFTIVGGSDSQKVCGIYVKSVYAGGQAAEKGLRINDEILAINGTTMHGLTHAQALQAFKAVKHGKMLIDISRKDSLHKRLQMKR